MQIADIVMTLTGTSAEGDKSYLVTKEKASEALRCGRRQYFQGLYQTNRRELRVRQSLQLFEKVNLDKCSNNIVDTQLK